MLLNTWQSFVRSRPRPTSCRNQARLTRKKWTRVASAADQLEDHTMQSAVTLVGKGGDFNWGNAVNWSSGAAPGATNDRFPRRGPVS
jgi:hypothetical protein